MKLKEFENEFISLMAPSALSIIKNKENFETTLRKAIFDKLFLNYKLLKVASSLFFKNRTNINLCEITELLHKKYAKKIYATCQSKNQRGILC